MKKLIFYLFLLSGINVFGQPTITQSQFPLAIGDILSTYLLSYSAPSEGTAQTWDYSGLILNTPVTTNIIDPVSSTIAGLPPLTTLCANISGSETCLIIDSAGMQITGLGGFGISFPYSDAEYLFIFPITYGASYSDVFYSDFYNGANGIRRGTVDNNVAGYGTLLLPGSITINNVMLVKDHEITIDSVDNSGTWSVTTSDMVTYYFFAANYHYYIMAMTNGSIITDGGPPTPVSTGRYNVLLSGTGIETNDISGNLEVYPNPAEDQFTLTNKGNINISGFKYSIVNMQGQTIKTGIINGDNLNFDVSGISSGLYILNINGEQFNASKRFVKK